MMGYWKTFLAVGVIYLVIGLIAYGTRLYMCRPNSGYTRVQRDKLIKEHSAVVLLCFSALCFGLSAIAYIGARI